MRRLLVIGMGAGDPAFVTVQAVDAINAVDVFFVIDKGEAKEDLVAVRQDVLNRYATPRGYRVVEIDDPQRDPGLPYEDAVARWHHERVLRFEQVLSNEVADGECAGFWSGVIRRSTTARCGSSIRCSLDEVAEEIVRVRGEARHRKGWMFDTYLLRRLDAS